MTRPEPFPVPAHRPEAFGPDSEPAVGPGCGAVNTLQGEQIGPAGGLVDGVPQLLPGGSQTLKDETDVV